MRLTQRRPGSTTRFGQVHVADVVFVYVHDHDHDDVRARARRETAGIAAE